MSHPVPLSGAASTALRTGRLLSLGGAILVSSNLHALEVDSELLLLVDVSIPGLSNVQFSDLMDSYAAAFTSSQVLDSIQSGSTGRIAVSMMFYGNSNVQQVGIPWMSIGSSSDADVFAGLVTSVNRPFSFGFSDSTAALAAATPTFGTETGGADNGFESSVQIIEVAASGIPFPFDGAATSAASNNALSSGVDLVNSTSLGFFGGLAEGYYEQNVIGSTIEGVEPTSGSSATGGDLSSNIAAGITVTVQTGASTSIAAIPEPSSLMITLCSVGFFLTRRRRR